MWRKKQKRLRCRVVSENPRRGTHEPSRLNTSYKLSSHQTQDTNIYTTRIRMKRKKEAERNAFFHLWRLKKERKRCAGEWGKKKIEWFYKSSALIHAKLYKFVYAWEELSSGSYEHISVWKYSIYFIYVYKSIDMSMGIIKASNISLCVYTNIITHVYTLLLLSDKALSCESTVAYLLQCIYNIYEFICTYVSYSMCILSVSLFMPA